MATITAESLAALRRRVARTAARKGIDINFSKPEINAALKALDDWFDLPATRGAASAAIDTAVPALGSTGAPFTNAQKKLIGAYWLIQKADSEKAGI